MKQINHTLLLAGSVLLGLTFIAVAIFFSGVPGSDTQAVKQNNQAKKQVDLATVASPKRENSSLRRIYGNKDAETTIVEFSDFECPYCSRLHPTLKRIIDESDGTINWEYRHLPLSIHASAKIAAISAECVADLAGNDTFWEYTDVLLANQRKISSSYLESEVQKLGIDMTSYKTCIDAVDIAARVQTDADRALSLGGSGTPFSAIVFSDGTVRVASGALPYANWTQILNTNK